LKALVTAADILITFGQTYVPETFGHDLMIIVVFNFD